MPERIKVEPVDLQVNAETERAKGQTLVGGERRELDDLFSAAYEELYRMATSVKRSRLNPSVSTGTLVNAAWLKLANAKRFAPESKKHFMCIAGKVMRHVLVEAARSRSAIKRGGREMSVSVSVDDLHISCDRDLLAVDAALKELERVSPRQAEIVEGRFFGGFEEAELAARLGISPSTVNREWRSAKAWLAAQTRRTS